jgi:hypothetical protein
MVRFNSNEKEEGTVDLYEGEPTIQSAIKDGL